MLHVSLNVGLVELSSNKSLGVEDSLSACGYERDERWKEMEGSAHTSRELNRPTRASWLCERTFRGFWGAWFLAASPTSRSSSVKATHDGVIRCPWSLAR